MSTEIVFQISNSRLNVKWAHLQEIKCIDQDAFAKDLKDAVHVIERINDTDRLAEAYREKLASIMDKYAPVIIKRVTVRKHNPWFLEEALKMKQALR